GGVLVPADPTKPPDNCQFVFNTNQLDTDGDNVGDVCDNCKNTPNSAQTDTDGDTVGDACDNCSLISNVDQANNDKDPLGDVCDPDDDNDGVNDVICVAGVMCDLSTCDPATSNQCVPLDNCHFNKNADQKNNDADALGDVCDDDDDNDAVDDTDDNCQF